MHRLFELSGTKLIAWSPPVPLAAVRHFKIAGLFARLFSRA